MQSTIEKIVARALREDIPYGDITTTALIPHTAIGQGAMICEEDGIIAGLNVAETTFTLVSPKTQFIPMVQDGQQVEAGTVIAEVKGGIADILTAERTALNFLQRMSGIATLTGQYVAAVKGTRASIIDTRKTAPGLRLLDKRAVVIGGGRNHRFGLSDGVLIKDNHIAYLQQQGMPLQDIISTVRQKVPHSIAIEVEITSLTTGLEVLDAHPNAILLDNMQPNDISEMVTITDQCCILEASGGINLQSVTGISKTGVDLISVGELTHSPRALNISLEL